MQFKYMSDFQYVSEERALLHLESGIYYRNYVGVGTVAKLGQPRLIKTLTRRFGSKRAKVIQENSVRRGNTIHKNIKKYSKVVAHPSWKSLGRDIFLFNRLLDNCPPVQGSLDELFIDPQGRYYLVEYKTKSSRASWNKYKSSCLPDYYRQVAAYEALLYKYYNIRVEGVFLFILFPDTEEFPVYQEVNRTMLNTGLSQFLRNLGEFND